MLEWNRSMTFFGKTLSGHEFEDTLGDNGGQGSLHAAVTGLQSQTRLTD